MALYLGEMFPLTAIIGNLATVVMVELVYLGMYNIKPAFSASLIFPAIVLTLVALLMRVMDEFKDYKDDLINFPGRPLPSGRVKRRDLQILGMFCVVMIIFLSSTSKTVLIWSFVILVYTGLMLKWFFVENVMRKSLPLAFISHHPIVILNFIYLIIVCQEFYPQVGWDKAWMIFPLCLMFTNWEVARKIRAPEQETAYTTYSKIIGPKKAISICLFLQLIFTSAAGLILKELDSPWPLLLIFLSLQGLLMWPYIRFFSTLKTKVMLKNLAEQQILLVTLSLLVAALL